MNSLRRAVPFAVIAVASIVVGIAVLRYYSKEKPFYVRLKEKKKRISYKLCNIRVHESTVIADLSNGKTSFIFNVNFLTDEILHFQINDSNYSRYAIQDVVVLNQKIPNGRINIRNKNGFLNIRYRNFKLLLNYDDFEICVYKNRDLLLHLNSEKSFLIEEKEPYVGIAADFLFPGAIKAYGLPQHAANLALSSTEDELYRLYNTDRYGYSATNPHESLYGTIPLLYAYGPKQTTGLLWLNSSETYVDVKYERHSLKSTFFSESGAAVFYVLSGPTFQDCVQQNSQLTGVVPLPPLFALGYHQCRFSYMSQEEVVEVSDKFDENGFPLDAVWMDIDCTDDKKYFTWNPDTYPNPDRLFDNLKNKNRKGVVIIDPHIKVDDKYFVYEQCKKYGYFVQDSTSNIFTAKCWPGTSTWIDFFNPQARQFYADLHKNFARFQNLHIWNDMNEPALFETKENAMPKNIVHYGNWKHRDVHNLYGFYQTMATYEGLLNRANLRPFVLTRSHFAGSQRFAAIWTGDNEATWAHLKISIPMCLTASLSGFSLCGADIGGFVHHPGDELLQRWYQLGAWLPFFRGHSNRNVPRREPYLYSKKMQERIRTSLQERYRHLLYWYTLFWQHCSTLEPVVRPLIYQYANDENVMDLDSAFLVGENILVCPVTEEQVQQIDIYLPGDAQEIWYCINHSTVLKYTGGTNITMPVDIDTFPVFYRGGAIIPIIEEPVSSSTFLIDCPVTFYIFADKSGSSSGNLYVDDTESFNYIQKQYNYFKFTLKNMEISSSHLHKNRNYQRPVMLSSINLYGFDTDISKIDVRINDEVRSNDVAIIQKNGFKQINNLNIDLQHTFLISLS